MTVLVYLGVAVGAGLGAVLRLVVDGLVSRRRVTSFPLGTLAVNVSGAFVLGLLTALVLPPSVSLIVGTGIIGAYTTFSTWMLQTFELAVGRRRTVAVANIVLPVAIGLAAAALGHWIGTAL